MTRWLAYPLLVLQLAACAAHRPAGGSATPREPLGVVGVRQVSHAASGELDVGPRGRLSGAATGAWQGASWLGLGPTPSCSAEGCIVVLGIVAASVVGGAMIGGVVGAMRAVPFETAEEIEQQLDATLHGIALEDALASEVVAVASNAGIPHVHLAAETGVDEVLDVALVQVGLVGTGGSDPDLTLCVLGSARLLRAADRAELLRSDDLAYASASRPFSEWRSAGARPLADEIRRAHGALAAGIVADVWPDAAVPDPSAVVGEACAIGCGAFSAVPCDAQGTRSPRAASAAG